MPQSLLDPARGIHVHDLDCGAFAASIGTLFAFAFVWSIGGVLAAPAARGAFDAFAREQLAPLARFPGALPVAVHLPSGWCTHRLKLGQVYCCHLHLNYVTSTRLTLCACAPATAADGATVYDYQVVALNGVDMAGSSAGAAPACELRPWCESVPAFVYDKQVGFHEVRHSPLPGLLCPLAPVV